MNAIKVTENNVVPLDNTNSKAQLYQYLIENGTDKQLAAQIAWELPSHVVINLLKGVKTQ